MTPGKEKRFRRLGFSLGVVWRLGLRSVATVIVYRLALRCGLLERRLPRGEAYEGDLFDTSQDVTNKGLSSPSGNPVLEQAEELLAGKALYFSYKKYSVGSPPDWFLNPHTRQRYAEPRQHWSKLSDFDLTIGDIKLVWELSRFDWALVFARAYRQSADRRFLETLNSWTSDWIQQNPLNTGPNWKCGQEASIRVQQVLLTAWILGNHEQPSAALIRFVFEHCRRVEPTLRYAIAQNNNHGTSEAAALFVAGAWLETFGRQPNMRQQGARWQRKGRKWLENRVTSLVEKDGSFSQYSVNYHRVLVDTLNIVEFWRRRLNVKEFSNTYYKRCLAAVVWLYHMVDESGDAPNLGTNDGARLFVLSNTPYRDYRPSVQLGMTLFGAGRVYPEGAWDEPLSWLQLEATGPPKIPKPASMEFSDGGYAVFRGGCSWGVVRFPRFRFRPGHADAFHLDLWSGGINLLRDSGSYSYNAEEPWQSYFASTAAHNTVEFDGRDQMPRLSRFLRGAWLTMNKSDDFSCDGAGDRWSGSYRDTLGAEHKRTVTRVSEIWTVVDEIRGVQSSAVLRWRLVPGHWHISGDKCVGELFQIQVTSSVPIKRFELQEGWESHFYLHKSRLQVLEIEVDSKEAVLMSQIHITA